MKLMDQLIARGEKADRMMGEIADREAIDEQKRMAYAAVGREFDKFASDGYLDKTELDQLLADFKAAGLDTATLEALAKELQGQDGTTRVTDDLRNAIGEQIREAEFEATNTDFAFEAQTLMSAHHQSYDLASRVSKGEHEIYMAAIKHLAC